MQIVSILYLLANCKYFVITCILLPVGLEEPLELDKRKVYDGKEGNVAMVVTFKRNYILTTAINALVNQSTKENRKRKKMRECVFALTNSIRCGNRSMDSSSKLLTNPFEILAASSLGSPEGVLSGEME